MGQWLSVFLPLLYRVVGGPGAYLQRSTGERRGTPWIGRQSIAGQHRDTQDRKPCTHSFTPTGKSERSINLIVMFFGLREKAGVPGENPRMSGSAVLDFVLVLCFV
ncbi:hypothetical protein ILYODFUR_038255 [Ilyodon furcidens]|uniref:Secreted protein n=1 Tax=Ilyodon furcidens TaxID=33524 RepID=A0ABV0VBB8_9TELE